MRAEQAYLFRHAVVRDAAYMLHVPTIRAELHLVAADVIEELFGESEDAAAISDHLAQYRMLSGDRTHLPREKAQLGAAGERASNQYDELEAQRRWARVAGLSVGNERFFALLRAGSAARSGGRTAEAEKTFSTVLAEAKAVDDETTQLKAKRALINLYVDVGRLREAEDLVETVPDGRMESDRARARVLTATGRVDAAERAYLKSLEAARKAGDVETESITLGGMSVLLINAGRAEEGEAYLEQALALVRGVDRRMEGFWTGSQGVRHAIGGRLDEACSHYALAMEIAHETGDRRSECMWLSYMATNAMERDELTEGERLFEQAIDLACEIGDIARESLSLGNLALLKTKQEDLDGAAALFERALILDRRGGSRQFEGAHLCEYAEVHLRRGDFSSAQRDWKAGTRLLEKQGDVETLETCRTQMREYCERAGLKPLE